MAYDSPFHCTLKTFASVAYEMAYELNHLLFWDMDLLSLVYTHNDSRTP